MQWIFAAFLMIGTPLSAQVAYPPVPDANALAAKTSAADVAAMIAAATPGPCAVPAPDTLTGTAGVAATCMPRADASRPTQVQRKAVVTAADGTFSGAWDTVWPVVPAVTFAQANTSVDPYVCQASTWTTITFSGRCWKLTASTLPATVTALPGYVMSPFTSTAGGVPVSIVGRQ